MAKTVKSKSTSSFKSSNPSTAKLGGASRSSSKVTPLGKRDYKKPSAADDFTQFGVSNFGQTGLSGED